jgi:hypothetical protein
MSSSIGYYRIKVKPSVSREVIIYSNNIEYCRINVVVKDALKKCSNNSVKYLKYLDKYGRYRFWMFNDKWKESITSSQIGNYSNYITSILDAQSDKSNIGYDANRQLTLRSEHLTNEEKDILNDIFMSPVVYMRAGEGDFKKDWIKVTVSGDGMLKDNSMSFTNIEITVTLPKNYNITK